MEKCKKAEEFVYQAVMNEELQIDKQGRVWRVAARRGNRWTGETNFVPCKKRRAEHDIGEYLQVRSMFKGTRVNALAHRLVYRHFKGPIPVNITINHKNGRKKDNRPENLELATLSEQTLHAVRVLKTHRSANQWGKTNHRTKLSTAQVKEIKKRRATGETLVSIARDYSIAFQTVSQIARGDRRSRG